MSPNHIKIGVLAAALVLVVAAGIITVTLPHHHANDGAARSHVSTVHVRILTDPKIIGKYSPDRITVHVNQPVIFTNNSNADHTVTDQQNAFNSGNMTVNSSWTLIPKKTGTFHYYCIYHQYMLGTIVVKPWKVSGRVNHRRRWVTGATRPDEFVGVAERESVANFVVGRQLFTHLHNV